MKAEAFLSRLEKVRNTGRGTWIACCPSHQDKSPSMTVRELEDGKVLVHCFAECPVESILSAVGMDFGDLFPDEPKESKPLRRPFAAADVLESVANETAIVVTVAHDVRRGVPVSDADYARLLVAAERIETARRMANG